MGPAREGSYFGVPKHRAIRTLTYSYKATAIWSFTSRQVPASGRAIRVVLVPDSRRRIQFNMAPVSFSRPAAGRGLGQTSPSDLALSCKDTGDYATVR